MPLNQSPNWWHPDRHADRRPFLLLRNRIAAALRNDFAQQDFVEVDPCALVVSPGNETHLQAFRTRLERPGEILERYLHTSPEFACKKLLAAGEVRIFTLSHTFRNGESGPLHAPEFKMLEWYRAHEQYQILMDDCIHILRIAADVANVSHATWRGVRCDLLAEPERLTLAEAFARHCAIDLHSSDIESLKACAQKFGLRVAADDTWSDLFSRLLADRIEPHLGAERATILYEYPISEAALARPSDADPRVAERFEIYVAGVELANCFGELTDPATQRARFVADMDEKQRIYGDRYPIDETFLSALAMMPPASGGALGFDRLVMLVSGALRIDDVQWAPVG